MRSVVVLLVAFVFWGEARVSETQHSLFFCRYCLREATGHSLPVFLSLNISCLIDLWVHLCLVDSFFARNEG